MEIENKDRYRVHIKYSKEILTTFVKFYNSVKHPRATIFMFSVGIMLFALPFVNHDIKLPGQIVCYVVGPIMFLLSLFRHNISVLMMKESDGMKVDEDIIYHFSNTGLTVEKSAGTEHMGNYKKIFRLFEDEKNFYMNINEEDLVVLPKNAFVEGDPDTFKEFILDKSGAKFVWKPVQIKNKVRWYMTQKKLQREEMWEERKGKKDKK